MNESRDNPSPVRASPGTLAALELETLLEVVASRAATDLGRRLVRQRRPAATEAELLERRAAFEEADRETLAQALIPQTDRALAPLLALLADPVSRVDGRDIVSLGELLRVAGDAKERIERADPPRPFLASVAAGIEHPRDLVAAIDGALDGRGHVRDDATPLLVGLRSRIRGVRDTLYERLGSVAEAHQDLLGEDTVPMRGGRLVLIVQAGAEGRIGGLTHGRSGTGRSVYFEPLDAVDLNNQLQQAVEDEEAERRRVVRELIDRLRDQREHVEACAQWVAQLDLLQSFSYYAQAVGARLAELAPRHELRLLDARHPLLDPALASWREEALRTAGHQSAVVPLDLELDAQRRVLVVTGPNAGGKTVALKTVGLLALTHLCGMPVPAAAGSRIPFLEAVVASVGDDQDLLADQSTFSGRLLRLEEAWKAAGAHALVLLDELGSGTDPEEGAALSVALVEHLVDTKCLVLATTHLTRVAAAALDLDGAWCAAMAFDQATSAPTYRLVAGPPGGSEAIALGRRLGLPAPWLARADALLGPEHLDLRGLLADVEAKRVQLETDVAEVAREREDLAALLRRAAEREAELLVERRAVGKRMRAQLDRFRLETKERLAEEVERMRRILEKPGAGAGTRQRLAAKATERLFEAAPEPPDEPPVLHQKVEVGRSVKHCGLGWLGKLEKLERGKAQVRVGSKLLRCAEGDLVAAADEAPGPKRARPAPAGPSLGSVKTEIILVGERVEEAIGRLDRFLDQAILAGAAEVRIVHGYGSGRLRNAVREHLRRHPAVAEHRAGGEGEGADGATVAALAG